VEANGCKLIQSTFKEHKVSLAEFQAEGTWLASASNEGTIELWDAGTLEPPSGMSGFKTQFKPPGASRPFSLVFGPKDDEVSVVCFNEPLRIWNLKSGEVREIPHIHNDQVMRYALTENRDRAAVSYNGRVVLATTPDLAQAAQPICPQGTIAFPLFSRDGEKLLTLSGAVWNSMDSVQVWRTEAPGPLPTVDKPFVGHPAPVWLADLAEAVGAQRIVSDEELSPPLILESLDNKYSEDDVEGPYEEVWRCFFPSGKQLSR
jgi:WD40 repeat protein